MAITRKDDLEAGTLLECVRCFQQFLFTEGERRFYETRVPPLTPPRRCKPCRAAVRAEREAADWQ